MLCAEQAIDLPARWVKERRVFLLNGPNSELCASSIRGGEEMTYRSPPLRPPPPQNAKGTQRLSRTLYDTRYLLYLVIQATGAGLVAGTAKTGD
jgi:hypothetical protein